MLLMDKKITFKEVKIMFKKPFIVAFNHRDYEKICNALDSVKRGLKIDWKWMRSREYLLEKGEISSIDFHMTEVIKIWVNDHGLSEFVSALSECGDVKHYLKRLK